MKKIILASRSPRRKQLLEWAGVSFEIVTQETLEDYPTGLEPDRVAMHIARKKGMAVKELLTRETTVRGTSDQNIILSADTIVVLGHKIIGKPTDRSDAVNILQQLSGKVHNVITGVCLLYKEREILFSDSTSVEFHHLSLAQIEYYVDSFKPFDKAGAYAIQEWIGVTGIKSIQGDFYNVMGLPISRVVMEVNLLDG